MYFLHANELREVWAFALGHSAPKDFENWVLSNPTAGRILGEELTEELTVADYGDRRGVADLRKRLFDWILPSAPARWRSLRYDELEWVDLGDGSVRRLLPIGYWSTGHGSNLPHPREYVDPNWDEAERSRIIDYMDSAYVLGGGLGFAWCRMGCPMTVADIGNRDLTDGTWAFPDGFAHYLRHHAVKPDGVFLEHVRRNSYHVPDLFARRGGEPLRRFVGERRGDPE